MGRLLSRARAGRENREGNRPTALHAGPCFVLPNAWDARSARILEQVGFPAIATTSAGIAWSC
jgi:2-methylisocitrate lyase-like PEP mutase family enzyme